MGRGRAKAKQTRVARELKYHSPDIDLDRLRADLGASVDGDFGDETDGAAGHAAWGDIYDEDDEARASAY